MASNSGGPLVRGHGSKRSANGASWKRVLRRAERPTAVTDDRKTISRAVELFLIEKRQEGLNGGVLKKYERELDRLNTFLESRSKFFPAEIDKELLIQYRDTWEVTYPSSATRQQVQARVRRFLRPARDTSKMGIFIKVEPNIGMTRFAWRAANILALLRLLCM